MLDDIERQIVELNQQVTQLSQNGRWQTAIDLAIHAHDLACQRLHRTHWLFAPSLNNLAAIHLFMGNYSDAEFLMREAIEIARHTVGETHRDYIACLNNLGTLYREIASYSAAEPLYRKAIDIGSQVFGNNDPDFAICLCNLAGLCRSLGNYTEAEQLYRQSSSIVRIAFGDTHPYVATSLNNLALLNEEMGNYSVAESLYCQVLEIDRMNLGEEHPDYATVLNNLGFVHYLMGNFPEARRLLRQALEIYGRAYGEDHLQYATSLSNLALLYHAMGNYAAVEPVYRQVLRVVGTVLGEDNPRLGGHINNLAHLYVAMNRGDEALTLMQRAMTFDDRLIGQVFSISSDVQRLSFLATLQCNLNAFLSLVSRRYVHSMEVVDAALDLVLRRKAITAEALAVQRDAVLSGKYPALVSQLRELTTLRCQIAQKTLAGPGPEGMPAHRNLLDQWRYQKERLEAELSRRIPEMNLEQNLRAADRRVVALALPAGMALVEFVRFDMFNFQAVPAWKQSRWQPARYLAFVLLAGEPVHAQLIDLGEAEPIDRLIADFRDSITGERDQNANRDMVKARTRPIPPDEDHTGRALRTEVFDRLASALGGRKRLFLAPDGDLTRLPFEVLPTGNGRRLIDDYHISYLGCGRDVLRFQAHSTGQRAVALVAADPDFDLRGDGKDPPRQQNATHNRQSRDLGRTDLCFDRLPGTGKEGERIAEMLNGRPWLQAEVLEQRLKQVRSPWILHLATHGFFLTDQHRDPNGYGWTASSELGRFSGLRLENPLLRSGLVLAGGNTWLRKGQLPPEAEDGLLTAEDVTGMDLSDTELVVLSACNTGLGEIRTGEGVFGLRRAFVLAGAKTLVMSLWKVPDEETRELMEDFYRRILAGEPRAEALRNAQLTMKAKYPHPFFWGAFICQGNPGSLPPKKQ